MNSYEAELTVKVGRRCWVGRTVFVSTKLLNVESYIMD